MSAKVLFLVPYPLSEAPSQRFRFEQYFTILQQHGFIFHVQSFLTKNNWRIFYSRSNAIAKAIALMGGFLKRIIALFHALSYDFIFIHREAAPVGPPVFEFILSKILRRKIIYDFDDAIWLTDKVNEGLLEKAIRCRGKIKWICKWSYKVSCGNEYLRNFAAHYNQNTFLIPTTIDTEYGHNFSLKKKSGKAEKIVIGWTGSHSTLKYLKLLEKDFQELEKKYSNLELHVIADKKPDLHLSSIHFKPWSQETEASDLALFDIGIMPLPDDEWAKGKCGFKALQYMSMEVATVASPVGVNTTIIKHGVNGLLAKDNEWIEMLTKLIEDETLRINLAKEGRKTVDHFYSVNSVKESFLKLFS
jgi:glycosyltransferase involved in cell wall biosynthesis